MQEMTKFAHPIELSDKELDLVAAGGSCGGGGDYNSGCKSGGSLVTVGDINVLDGNQTNVGVNLFGKQEQSNFIW
jgi:hypothetical protein